MTTIVLNKWSDVVLPERGRYQMAVTRDRKIVFIEADMNEHINKNQRTFREDFTVNILDRNDVTSFVTKDLPFPPSHIDTYTDGTFLLVSGRCWRGHDWVQHNARRCSADGECLDEFVLGDGISTLAIDDEDKIWAGYFDEGVYGNLGWDEPIGRSGLVAFSESGEILFRPKLPMIHELLSLNVDRADSVYAYYTLFSSIVHFDHFEEVQNSEIHQSIDIGPIMLLDDELLLTYDYRIRALSLLKKHEGVFTKEKEFRLEDADGNDLNKGNAVIRMRGNHLFLLNDSGIYQVEVTAEMLV
ncbi:hypothetical protein [Jeotgalibacillus terrae]|uniref:Uncharacterized protein n=1 Tax=Jeotgalibacillus terrae TaxID=587735 RepID=A0ABW5ZD31_9BACL|nr:hypothetical protein [Jeotgalibacillus terrae]MBM7579120.1 hypothetical protein [Jeotgalibacillus terrae]